MKHAGRRRLAGNRPGGPRIPLGARILAAANDYNSLQIGALAEKKFSPEEARNALIQLRGKRYCPQVIDAGDILGEPREEARRESEVPLGKLEVGMVLARGLLSAAVKNFDNDHKGPP